MIDPICPKCDARLVSEPSGMPYKCKHCGWHLLTYLEWRQLSAFQQGVVMYMQGNWPTSPLAGKQNPYARNSPEWSEFIEGERQGARIAQDSEE